MVDAQRAVVLDGDGVLRLIDPVGRRQRWMQALRTRQELLGASACDAQRLAISAQGVDAEPDAPGATATGIYDEQGGLVTRFRWPDGRPVLHAQIIPLPQDEAYLLAFDERLADRPWAERRSPTA